MKTTTATANRAMKCPNCGYQHQEERLTLSPAELIEVTGFRQTKKQHEFFVKMGVPAMIRGDNTLSVARAHYHDYQQLKEVTAAKRRSTFKVHQAC